MSVDKQDLTDNYQTFGETPEERADWLSGELQVILDWCGQLGDKGAAFLKALYDADVDIDIDLSESDAAAYYSHEMGKGFPNKIMLGRGALSSREQFFTSFSHEVFHALQNNCAPALHATMAVSGLDIALCPRHHVWALELTERDAYAKQILFSILLAEVDPERAVGLEKLSLPPSRYADILKQHPARALTLFGEYMMHEVSGGHSMKDWYNAYVLAHFQALLEERQAQGKPLPLFVRMEEDDARAIGNSMDINSFGPPGLIHEELDKPPKLSTTNEAQTLALNDALGIQDERQLLTLRELLAMRNVTKAQFMAACRANNPPPSLILPNGNSAPRPPGP